VLRGLLGGDTPTTEWLLARPMDRATGSGGGAAPTDRRARVLPLDAGLDTPGTPQSGTGQAALLTGESTARAFGGHFGPWTPVALRPVVEQRSLLRRAVDAGRSVAFANAYPRGWPGPGGSRRIAAPPLAARGAGLLVRHEEALGLGDAVSSEIVNDGWKRHLGHDTLPDVTPREAGANLGRIAAHHELTLFAHYTTDTVGHRGNMSAAVEALELVDAFLGGVVASLSRDTLLFVASDHGNIEDIRSGHTRNPALGLVAPPLEAETVSLAHPLPSDLREVAPFLLRFLGVETGSGL
jgi:2,3-bisphosphoglycerate-independent phosphoglycerate mutase